MAFPALSPTDWDRAALTGAFPMRDDDDATDDAASGAPCASCRDFRSELERVNGKLAKANALLRVIRRVEPKPDKPEGLDDDATELLVIAHAAALAKIRARIDLYLSGTGQRL